ncbi:MAG TPA: TetR/AcrR family transcriptional regulator [Gemmatimonadales bacterium]|nr:TetR/AcrR family transcriptional regulator [Gemmatimonadales bacterium]
MKSTRAYRMQARAAGVVQTRQRILRAAFDLSHEKMSLEIVFTDIAERAGVSVQTILRHFGSRDRLLDAVAAFARREIAQERVAPIGDVDAAVRVIFDHYERRGDAVLRFIGQESFDERIRQVTERGRSMHRDWVERVFAPQLAAHPARDRAALTDLLGVATDVYTWKLLRRDRALGLQSARARVRQLITAIMSKPREAP